MTQIKNHFNSQKLDVPFCAWKLCDNEANEIIEFILQPGEFIDTHANPKSVFFYVLKGTGTLTIEKKDHILSVHDCIYVEKDLQRKWNNNGSSELQVLVIKQLL